MKNGFDMVTDQFLVESGTLIVSDPCYEKDGELQAVIDNVFNGPWEMETICSDEGTFGNRVSVLIATAVGSVCREKDWKHVDADIPVDSGQAGIFDLKYFKDDNVVRHIELLNKDEVICEEEPWYSLCCDRTLGEEKAGVVPFGAVSSSGYGDGCYSCFICKNKDGKVIGVKIVFIEDEDEKDEDNDMYCVDEELAYKRYEDEDDGNDDEDED